MTWNEDDIWFAVIGEDSHDDYPVVAGSGYPFDHPKESVAIQTFELAEEHVDIEGTAYLALWDNGLFHDKARVIAKTRMEAFSAMCKVIRHSHEATLEERYDL